MQHTIHADDLLAGANATFVVEVPAAVVRPGGEADAKPIQVELRPISIGAFQLILKAAREDPGMIPLLMIKEALVAPQMNLAQVQRMHLGLVEFLIAQIRAVSGMDEKKNS
jgi:hypothetical protein